MGVPEMESMWHEGDDVREAIVCCCKTKLNYVTYIQIEHLSCSVVEHSV